MVAFQGFPKTDNTSGDEGIVQSYWSDCRGEKMVENLQSRGQYHRGSGRVVIEGSQE